MHGTVWHETKEKKIKLNRISLIITVFEFITRSNSVLYYGTWLSSCGFHLLFAEYQKWLSQRINASNKILRWKSNWQEKQNSLQNFDKWLFSLLARFLLLQYYLDWPGLSLKNLISSKEKVISSSFKTNQYEQIFIHQSQDDAKICWYV